MNEKYCTECRLVHRDDIESCCVCDRELVEKPESSDGEDKTCYICIREDKNEMA